MKQKAQHRVLAILLIFCLSAGLLQGFGTVASAAELDLEDGVPTAAIEGELNADEVWLQDSINASNGDETPIRVEKRIVLTKPIIIPEGKKVAIKGVDKDKSIITTELKDE